MSRKRFAAGGLVLATLAGMVGATRHDVAAGDPAGPTKTIPTLPSTTSPSGPAPTEPATSAPSSTEPTSTDPPSAGATTEPTDNSIDPSTTDPPPTSDLPSTTLPRPTTSGQSGGTATGIGLRVEARLPEFLPVVNDMVGATNDVAGELAALAEVPAGVLSPLGSSIHEFSIAYFGLDEHFVASAAFTTNATAEDSAVFYQATLAAAGFTPVADTGVPEGDETTRTLNFTNPNSPYDSAGVAVAVTYGEVGDPTEIELTIVDSIGPETLTAFTGWAAGFPTLSEAEPLAATIDVTAGSSPGDITLRLSTTFTYSGFTPEQLTVAVRAALPRGGFSIDPDNDSGDGSTIAVRHLAMDDVTAEAGAAETAATDTSTSTGSSGTPAPTSILVVSGSVTF